MSRLTHFSLNWHSARYIGRDGYFVNLEKADDGKLLLRCTNMELLKDSYYVDITDKFEVAL